MNGHRLIERQLRHWNRMTAVLKRTPAGKSLAEVTKRPVLTVSGTVGSGRERLAKALCKELEYELFGRELLDAVASDLHCRRMLLDSLDERVQSNLEVMFESLIHGREFENQDYIHSLVRGIGSLAEKGGAVILGRCGASVVGKQAALRILVEASVPVRVRRLIEWRQISESEARHYVETHDQEQKKFCRYYFHCDICNPLNYDLMINTDRTEPEDAVKIVLAALAARGIKISKPELQHAER